MNKLIPLSEAIDVDMRISRREAALENALRELLECYHLSGEYQSIGYGGKSQSLRAQADYIDRCDAALIHARKLIQFDPKFG